MLEIFLDCHIFLETICTVNAGNTQRLLRNYSKPEYKIYYLSLKKEKKKKKTTNQQYTHTQKEKNKTKKPT